MKKIMLLALPAVFVFSNLIAQQHFEGRVVYDILFDSASVPPEAMSMLRGAEATTFIKGMKRRVDIDMRVQSTSMISDDKSGTLATLMNILGQKYLILMNSAELAKEELNAPALRIEYVEGSRLLAGYDCKKALLTPVILSDGPPAAGKAMEAYYTTEIPVSEIKPAIKGLKGFPLEYSTVQAGVKMTFRAKLVSKEKVSKKAFRLPGKEYRKVSMDEFQNEMKKLMGE